MTRPVLLDNTVLVNFACADRADLVLESGFERVCTTPAVMTEYESGVESGHVPDGLWGSLPQLDCTAEESAFARSLADRLGAGERSCLAIALHRQGLFASDDADARAEAQKHDIPVTGTLGILIVNVEHDVLTRDAANTVLQTVVEAGYRSPVDRIDPLLD